MANGLTAFEVTAVESDVVHLLPSGGRHVRKIQRRDVELAQGGVGRTHAASIVGILRALVAPYRPPASIRKE